MSNQSIPPTLARPLLFAVAALTLAIYAAAFALLIAGRDPGALAVGALGGTAVLLPASRIL